MSAEALTAPPVDPVIAPLEGFTVGITAARRREELEALLERRGARVISAPAIRIVPVADDGELLAATRACIATPPALVVATTGIGFRGWMEAADGWGLGEDLLDVLGAALCVARGPKATGAIRAAGLREEWAPASESSSEVLGWLLARDLRGVKVAVQLHGEAQLDFTSALRSAGAEVIEVPVYRWVLPEDVVPVRRLIEATIARQVDAIAFTSAPAVVSMLRLAEAQQRRGDLVDALRHDVLAACVGPVCAAPLEEAGVTCVMPERARLGALVRTIAEELPAQRSVHVTVAGRDLEIRGHSVILCGEAVKLAPGPRAVLAALAAEPGRVLSRESLLSVMPGDTVDGHALEMTVARLRTALGDPRAVLTVVKRGYRLNADGAA